MIECSGVAVRTADSEGWVALCPEYDIASEGRTFSEAFSRLVTMIETAVGAAQEYKLAIGRAVEPEPLRAFLASHVGEQPRVRRRWRINTDTLESEVVETELIR